jgi:ribonuclease P protein component
LTDTVPGRFPRTRRLLTRVDFDRVFSAPVRSADAYFLVLGRSAENDAHLARLGMAIGKKCARRAVDRNRLKRLARDSFRRFDWNDCPLDVVVLCRPAAVGADNRRLHASLGLHWARLKAQADRAARTSNPPRDANGSVR